MRGSAIAALLLVAGCAAAEAAGGCPAPEGNSARLVSLDERLEPVLDSGTRLRLWGIEVPAREAGPAAVAQKSLQAWLTPAELLVSLRAAIPDRWGRIEAHVFAPAPGGLLDVSLALVDAGLARVRPERDDPGCQADLFALESAARQAQLGLWADPRDRPLHATDRGAFMRRSGEIVLVEGTVQSQNEGRFGAFLNFGPARKVDFAVSIRPPVLSSLRARGIEPAALTGRRVRVRGLLDLRSGPMIDLSEASALEDLDAPLVRSPYSGP